MAVVQVYDKKSSSRCWLEKHVPLHGGKFAFTCIVEGCKLRFSSQVPYLHTGTVHLYVRCFSIPDLESWILDPGSSENKKEEGEINLASYGTFHKLENYFYF
jgi:hypothetical protein